MNQFVRTHNSCRYCTELYVVLSGPITVHAWSTATIARSLSCNYMQLPVYTQDIIFIVLACIKRLLVPFVRIS